MLIDDKTEIVTPHLYSQIFAKCLLSQGDPFTRQLPLFLSISEGQSPLAFTLVASPFTPTEEIDVALNVLSKDVHLPACAVRTVLVSQSRMLSSMEVELGLMLGVAFILSFRFTS